MKTWVEFNGTALRFLLPRRYVEMCRQRHASAILPPRKEPTYALCRRLSAPKDRSGWVWKFSPTTGLRSPDRPAHSESLYRLSYPGRSVVIIKALSNIFTLAITIKN